jgi:hypothetical protein
MAAVTRIAAPSLASNLPPPSEQTTGLTAGAALAKFDAVYINADGKVYPSTGAAATAPAEVNGYAAEAYALGDKRVTMYHGNITVNYGSGNTPGSHVWLSETTAGQLQNTVGAAGGTRKLGYFLDATRLRLYAAQGR